MARKLTQKQKCFVEEYMIDLNAAKAAVNAGHYEKNAGRIGPELLGKTCISKDDLEPRSGLLWEMM